MEFSVVIPARYASTRLPGKPLRQIAGKPMVEWVWRAAIASGATDVIVATDDERIVKTVESFSGQACMTSPDHQTGTDRIVEVITKNNWQDDRIIVNLQGDEPLMPAANIRQVAVNLDRTECDMTTLHERISADQAHNPAQVKLVIDHEGNALYFSRSMIPFDRTGSEPDWLGHIGIYAYRSGFVQRYASLSMGQLEQAESLEQLRALYHGYRIHSELAAEPVGPGVDTEADLQRAEARLSSHQ